MIQKIPVAEFLTLASQLSVIDVRSPKEFCKGHITGAHNIPLFDDEERAKVGITYKQTGRDEAIKIGLGIAGNKLNDIVKAATEIATNKKVLLHCWRGGMRSESVAWLLDKAGFEVYVLVKGYKAFRNFLNQLFAKPANILVLGGMTGSGKTEILHELGRSGQQVIDLEGLAHHKGSAFGALGKPPQPTTEQFQNDLFNIWQSFDHTKPIWLEDESLTIGTVFLPMPLHEQMRKAPVIKIEMEQLLRAQRLVKEYAGYEREALKETFAKITQRLGGQNVKKANEAIDRDDYLTAATISLQYYDKAYIHGLLQRDPNTIFPITVTEDNCWKTASMILKTYNHLKTPACASLEIEIGN